MLSRTADSLYWMGRYFERAEYTARLLHVHLDLTLDQPEATTDLRRQYVLAILDLPLNYEHVTDDYTLTDFMVFDEENLDSVKSCISAARENARQVREQISSEMWNQLNEFYLYVDKADVDATWSAQPQEFLHNINAGALTFQGITNSTMNHDQGWHFVEAGRSIERVLTTVRNLRVHFCRDEYSPESAQNESALDEGLRWTSALRICTALEAYTKYHTARLVPEKILDFLLLNPVFPHSVAFAVNMLHEALKGVVDSTHKQRSDRGYRRAARLSAELQYAEVDEILESGLEEYLREITKQCLQIHEAIYDAYITHDLPEEEDAKTEALVEVDRLGLKSQPDTGNLMKQVNLLRER